MLASSSNSWENKNYNKHKSFQCYFAVSYNIINILLNHLQILNEGERNNRAREPGRTTIWSNKTVDRILGRKKISFAISHQM